MGFRITGLPFEHFAHLFALSAEEPDLRDAARVSEGISVVILAPDLAQDRHVGANLASCLCAAAGLPGEDDARCGAGGALPDPIRQFLTDSDHARATERVLTTVLFADIVDSTRRAATLGDGGWRELLVAFRDRVRELLDLYRGREIDTAGDGFLASFDGPTRGVRCAGAICDAVRPLGLEVRCGLHTGECELVGEGVAGIAVHIGARVASLAGAGEVLVTQTVRDLVTGSGLAFADHGSHTIKGVSREWHLFRAMTGAGAPRMTTAATRAAARRAGVISRPGIKNL